MRNNDYLLWLKNRNAKNLKLRTRLKLCKKAVDTKINQSNYQKNIERLSVSGDCRSGKSLAHQPNRYSAPENFSITENFDETISYFNRIFEKLKNKKHRNKNIYFDLSNIKYLSASSTMYLIATVTNIKKKPIFKYHFEGNFPRDEKINSYLRGIGFTKYVNSNYVQQILPQDPCIEIKSGNTIDRVTVQQICDFVNASFGTDKIYTKFLYKMIVELMTNTKEHAYKSNSFWANCWYIFVTKRNNKIKFVFLDTGDGIPKTIAKKKLETISDVVGIASDSNYIFSALKGEFRTNTRKAYRGKGLPLIYKYYSDMTIQNLKVISGKGFCNFVTAESGAENTIFDKSHNMYGTLFCWEIINNTERKECLHD